ncbi:MAG TPA: hypothetical protein VMV56_06220 [Williamwhitmania sp.]|nr:hypothetical protein [Williamwhitmania sp.]
MPYLASIFEIALFIVLPLIVYCQQCYASRKQLILNIALLYSIWFLSYAFLHELSHMFGSWITGAKISGYQLIPPFWKGDFRTAFINSIFKNETQTVVSTIMPYLRDIIFLIAGLWIFRRKKLRHHFLNGLLLTLLVFSPLYDIINNYSGFVFYSYGDFNELSKAAGVVYTNIAGTLFTVIAIAITLRIFVVYKKQIPTQKSTTR